MNQLCSANKTSSALIPLGRRSSRVWRAEAEPGSKLKKKRRPLKYEPQRKVETKVVEMLQKRIRELTPAEKLLKSFKSVPAEETEPELLDGPLPGRFRSFNFHNNLDVLVAEDEEGRLNLARCYLYDMDSKIYAKPFCGKGVPDEYKGYSVQEWDTWISGDVAFGEEEHTELEKVYFVAQLPLQGNQMYPHLKLEEVYCIDSATRRVEKAKVFDFRDKNTVDPILRIKEDGVVMIVDSRDCPTRDELALREDLNDYLEHQWKAKEDLIDLDHSLLEEAEDVEASMEEEPDLPEADM